MKVPWFHFRICLETFGDRQITIVNLGNGHVCPLFIVMQASVHLSACLPDAGAVIKQKTNIFIYTTNRFNRHAGYPDIP